MTARTAAGWTDVPARLRARGLRWTPQRRILVEVLADTDGHITGAALVERCRERDRDTIPSTVYRTLDVLEQLGYVRHSHSAAGREEFHVLPAVEHGHLECRGCGGVWELEPADAAHVIDPIEAKFGFSADVGHLTISGLCAGCAGSAATDDA